MICSVRIRIMPCSAEIFRDLTAKTENAAGVVVEVVQIFIALHLRNIIARACRCVVNGCRMIGRVIDQHMLVRIGCLRGVFQIKTYSIVAEICDVLKVIVVVGLTVLRVVNEVVVRRVVFIAAAEGNTRNMMILVLGLEVITGVIILRDFSDIVTGGVERKRLTGIVTVYSSFGLTGDIIVGINVDLVAPVINQITVGFYVNRNIVVIVFDRTAVVNRGDLDILGANGDRLRVDKGIAVAALLNIILNAVDRVSRNIHARVGAIASVVAIDRGGDIELGTFLHTVGSPPCAGGSGQAGGSGNCRGTILALITVGTVFNNNLLHLSNRCCAVGVVGEGALILGGIDFKNNIGEGVFGAFLNIDLRIVVLGVSVRIFLTVIIPFGSRQVFGRAGVYRYIGN